jgi:hypothetical protein
MGVCAFAFPGAMRGGERVGERKNVPRDQEILVLGAYRMPIYTIGRDGDFRDLLGRSIRIANRLSGSENP